MLGANLGLLLYGESSVMYRKFYLFILLLKLETIFNQDMLFISQLNVILALQRSETYKYIKRPFRRLYSTHNGNSIFSWNNCLILLIGVICLWLIDLLIQSGDIHPNPGPDSVRSIADISCSSSEISLHTLINHLSIMHLNVQSIVQKMDLIKCEAQAYDILVCSENWLKPDQVRYHCSILPLLKFLRLVSKTMQRKIWKYAQADFSQYRSLLFESGL